VKNEMMDIKTKMNQEDTALFESAGDYFRGLLDLDEVRNDPALEAVRSDAGNLVSEFIVNKKKSGGNRDFIRAGQGMGLTDTNAAGEIEEIKFEIHRSNVNDLTAEWVKEWHENKKKSVAGDKKSKERKEFILSSLEPEGTLPEKREAQINQASKSNQRIKRIQLIRYISLSVAAVLGIFILVRALLPSYDPEKLYSSYYSPFEMVAPMTRSSGINSADEFSLAVEKYRSGDYISAKASFSGLSSADPSSIATRFMLGLSCLAMNEFDNAVGLLEKIAESTGTYRKEATWYLGLAYLKKGEKEKAAKCFGSLVSSPGYYTDRATELLRHLK
jgi:TolA-binding protein